MSKTRGNLVPASEMGETWGVDTQRVYTLAVAPADQDAEWLDEGVKGSNRLIRNVFDLVHSLAGLLKGVDVDGMDPGALSEAARDLRRKAHETILKVTQDLEGRFSFHTAIARITELKNALPAVETVAKWTNDHDRKAVVEAIETLVVVFAPFAPHVCEELWHEALGHAGSVFDRAWPQASEHALQVEAIEYAVQVNGKIKAKALFPADASDEQLSSLAKGLPDVEKAVAGKNVKMVKVVRGRLVNIVVAG
jgi:leucyl-tRNA synthetase